MTLNQLVYFQKIAALENYRRAAEALFISQPSLSRSMAQLEEELGVQLFEKSGRGVRLTRAGRLFLEYADQILNTCQIASAKMEEMASGKGSIAIGYIFPLAGSYIPGSVRAFLEEEGHGITFNFWQNHTPAIYRKIQEGELDVGFGGCIDNMDEPGIEFYPLLQQELVILTPENHPLAHQDQLPLSVLGEHPVIGYDKDSWMGMHTAELYAAFRIAADIVVECPDEYSIVSLVRENFGIALTPRTDLLKEAQGVVIHPIADGRLYHQIYMFWDNERYHLPAVRHFIEYMQQQAENSQPAENEDGLPLRDIIRL